MDLYVEGLFKSAFRFNDFPIFVHVFIIVYLLWGVTSAEKYEALPLSLWHPSISSSSGNQCSNKASF